MKSARIRVKFCGMTRAEDIDCAAQLGADAIGLIVHPASPRAVTIDKARALTAQTRLWLDKVAVLVNPEAALVQALLAQVPIDYLQFHGDESAEFCRQFGRPYIKAIAARDRNYIDASMRLYPDAAAILLDTPTQAHGGSGRVFDWTIVPQASDQPIILAGGLSPDNLGAAIKAVAPVAVDLNSGVEQSPGVKDHAKMKVIIQLLGGGA